MAMMRGDGPEEDDDAAPIAEINVTPLVDVMLVLLIVFMVAAPMMTAGVKVDLPRSAAPRSSDPRPPVMLTLTREGTIHLDRDEVAEAALPARLAALREADTAVTVHVRGDRAVPYGEVLRVMGRVAAAGITRVALVSEGETPAGGR
ncbi:ExbD/TolR family protein [Falsiroseomonas sp. CW058]|uniref:ExbD/TolR family protein n=1 Tax=Falsiroseomonas sp. CW058 TaxID=3388664 RepID=UPI003D30F95B